MSGKAKKRIPKYANGKEVVLKNKWALAQNPNGLSAKIVGTRNAPDGEVIYNIEAQRPPVPMSVLESDLDKISER